MGDPEELGRGGPDERGSHPAIQPGSREAVLKKCDSYRERVGEHRIPRGIVAEATARTMFTLTRHAPAPELAEFVDYHWVLRWDLRGKPAHEQRVLPNLAVHVTFFPGASGVHGPGRDVFSHRLEGRVQGLGVRFRPGSFRAFLGRSVSDIADRAVPLTDVFGPTAIDAAESVRTAADDAQMVRAIDNLLIAKPVRLSPAARRAVEAVESIAHDPGITRVAQLCADTGLTTRAVQRLFAEHVGCPPKWAIRIYRLNDAAQRIATEGDPDYAGLAVRLGYSDQSHFIRDFRTVTGQSPAEYTRTARAAAEPEPDSDRT
ncbi:AraC family transcriptional regulator [Amycolatopsis sp. OK19-0408]|uniref:AraC family transcriptional regulator n=1 Tax=Amycolatopsis iheyensis TaxID=2945988 RepID=A0A9X2N600_9PSEU|nr:AraC family transcriptional regulator [Amycolatopsis iheyensis]MCR6481472.1 AraC family transcriptional regulator [Amycolatopsis iheyensis]